MKRKTGVMLKTRILGLYWEKFGTLCQLWPRQWRMAALLQPGFHMHPRWDLETSQDDIQNADKFMQPDTPTIPLASHVEIEHECRLPELRVAGMAADELIEDAAGALLNILSTLNITR